ncbi:hypothetical protein [Sulfurospirillum sp.]|uniref:hypothetical protein n=1 Tax=Sulfurospirillum sp. TaxID=2053622 RepID=UPI002FDDDB64
MLEYDIIIVGSGASASASALQLSHMGIKPLVIDVGLSPVHRIENQENLYTLKSLQDCSSFLVGNSLEYFNPEKQVLPAKLKSPYFQYVTDDPDFFKVSQTHYNVITSYAKGGLGVAWGNGLMRFSEEDFLELPITFEDIVPFYKTLESHIGISGENDDLSRFFGMLDTLQRPLKLSQKSQKIANYYSKNRTTLHEKNIFLGRPRIGVSDNTFHQRDRCSYDNLEFWQPDHTALYTPVMTLQELIVHDKIVYQGNCFVDHWVENEGKIEVVGYDITSKEEYRFKAKKIIIAAGVVNTARIVLKSRNDYTTKLRLTDNPAIQFPFFFPGHFGKPLEIDSFGLTQLSMIYKSKLLKKKIIGAFVEVTSPMRSEFFDKFPFPATDNLNFMKYILPGMMASQIFLPSDPEIFAELLLNRENNIDIIGTGHEIPQPLIHEAVEVLRSLGLLTLEGFAYRVSHGNGIHYGGTLPMSLNPTSPYETTVNGELPENKNVYIADGSTFKCIPATNYSLTLMANAMRIAQQCGNR